MKVKTTVDVREEQPDNYEPPVGDRKFYRSATTGDRAYLVRRDGRDCVKLDRPMEDICKPFRPDDWIEEMKFAPLARAHIVQVAFEADKRLLPFLGLRLEARKEWLSLLDPERLQWLQDGPPRSKDKNHQEMRRALWDSTIAALEPFTREK